MQGVNRKLSFNSRIARSPGRPQGIRALAAFAYTMMIKSRKDRPIGVVHGHGADVANAERRKIQDGICGTTGRAKTRGEIRTVGRGWMLRLCSRDPQALKEKPKGRWKQLREANRAIAALVMYRFHGKEEIERAYAIIAFGFSLRAGL